MAIIIMMTNPLQKYTAIQNVQMYTANRNSTRVGSLFIIVLSFIIIKSCVRCTYTKNLRWMGKYTYKKMVNIGRNSRFKTVASLESWNVCSQVCKLGEIFARFICEQKWVRLFGARDALLFHNEKNSTVLSSCQQKLQ